MANFPIPGTTTGCCGNPTQHAPRPANPDGRARPRPRPTNNSGSGGNGNGNGNGSGGRPVLENGVLVRRRASFFSALLYRLSLLLQRPSALRPWELVLLAFAGFAAHAALGRGAEVYDVVARRAIGEVCPAGTVATCLRGLLGFLVVQVWRWLARVVPWAVVAGVLAFVGEEVTGMLRRRKA